MRNVQESARFSLPQEAFCSWGGVFTAPWWSGTGTVVFSLTSPWWKCGARRAESEKPAGIFQLSRAAAHILRSEIFSSPWCFFKKRRGFEITMVEDLRTIIGGPSNFRRRPFEQKVKLFQSAVRGSLPPWWRDFEFSVEDFLFASSDFSRSQMIFAPRG